jgi:hypothetical protein
MIKIFLKRQIKKLTDNLVRVKTFRDYEDIRKVILLFDIEDLAVVKTFVDTLIVDGKQVSAYSFDAKKNVYPQLPEHFKIWNKDQLDFYGIPKSAGLSAFTEHTADTLIDLTNASSLVLRYLFLHAPADFRVGFNRDNALLYDLLIERSQEQDFAFFVNQLLFYMKRLRTK